MGVWNITYAPLSDTFWIRSETDVDRHESDHKGLHNTRNSGNVSGCKVDRHEGDRKGLHPSTPLPPPLQ